MSLGMKFWIWGFILSLGFEPALNAATYNFYFNNTEQGANSQATPSLVVQDGKEGTYGPQPLKVEEAPSDSEEPPSATRVVDSPSKTYVNPPVRGSRSALPTRIRFGHSFQKASRMVLQRTREPFDDYRGGSYRLVKQKEDLVVATFDFEVFPIQQLAFGLFMGTFSGAELKFYPFESLGGPIHFGVGAGFTYDSFFPFSGERNSFHLGAEFCLPIGKHFDLAILGRLTPFEDDFNYSSLGLGFHVRF